MNTIASLLDPETAAKLGAFATVAVLSDEEPARRRMTVADAIEIDPRSEAMIAATCADCREATVYLDPTPVTGHEGTPRVPLCPPCGKAQAKMAAAEQRRVMVIRKPQIAKHQPRTTDGLTHEVVVTRTNTQENAMQIDFNNMSDAEIGRMMRAEMEAKIEAALPAKREEALAEVAKVEKASKKAKKGEQKAKQAGSPLAEFVACTIKGEPLVIPALDLSDVADLDVAVSTTLRSPYNKARFHLEGSKPLPSPAACEDDASLTVTTYAVLAVEHLRLMEVAAAKAVEKAAKAETPKAEPKKAKAPKAAKPEPVTATVAALSEDDLAVKVKALRKVVPGLSKKDARAQVLALLSL